MNWKRVAVAGALALLAGAALPYLPVPQAVAWGAWIALDLLLIWWIMPRNGRTL